VSAVPAGLTFAARAVDLPFAWGNAEESREQKEAGGAYQAATAAYQTDRCHIPDDHVDPKRRGYLWGKEVLEELIEGLKRQEEEA